MNLTTDPCYQPDPSQEASLRSYVLFLYKFVPAGGGPSRSENDPLHHSTTTTVVLLNLLYFQFVAAATWKGDNRPRDVSPAPVPYHYIPLLGENSFHIPTPVGKLARVPVPYLYHSRARVFFHHSSPAAESAPVPVQSTPAQISKSILLQIVLENWAQFQSQSARV